MCQVGKAYSNGKWDGRCLSTKSPAYLSLMRVKLSRSFKKSPERVKFVQLETASIGKACNG